MTVSISRTLSLGHTVPPKDTCGRAMRAEYLFELRAWLDLDPFKIVDSVHLIIGPALPSDPRTNIT